MEPIRIFYFSDVLCIWERQRLNGNVGHRVIEANIRE
jgi:hypothetical protein